MPIHEAACFSSCRQYPTPLGVNMEGNRSTKWRDDAATPLQLLLILPTFPCSDGELEEATAAMYRGGRGDRGLRLPLGDGGKGRACRVYAPPNTNDEVSCVAVWSTSRTPSATDAAAFSAAAFDTRFPPIPLTSL